MPTPNKLSPSQQAVLTAAARNKQGLAVSFPDTLKGGARVKVLHALVQSGYLERVEGGEALRISQAGYQALGIKPPKPRQLKAGSSTPIPRQHSKQAQVIEMLKRPQGASIEQVMQATDWQQHTVRGFFAGALKKRLRLPITSDKADGAKRVYRIAPDAANPANDATGAQ